jgi:hypothetical protein
MRIIRFLVPNISITPCWKTRITTVPRTLSIRSMSNTKEHQMTHEAPWHAAYPTPKSEAVGISQSDLLAMLEDGKEPGKDFVLVDLRRNDHAVRENEENPWKLLTHRRREALLQVPSICLLRVCILLSLPCIS